MNFVCIVGRITKDIELRTTDNGKNVVKFTLAVNKDKEHTNFINCVVWNKLAETMAKYCKKGDLIGVNGEIQTGSYENSKGDKVYTTEVLTNKITFLSTKQEEKTKVQEQQEILNKVVNEEKDIFQEFADENAENLELPF